MGHPQFGIPEGKIINTVLIGTLGAKDTWFQLEGAQWDPFHDVPNSVKHCIDWAMYFLSGRQMGPLGSSIYTDKNPLIVGKPENFNHACDERCTTIETNLARKARLSPLGAGV